MAWRWLLWWRPPCVLRMVIANLKDDPSVAIKGVLWSSRGGWFTLIDAELLKAGAEPARIDGTVVVHRNNVAFLQVLP